MSLLHKMFLPSYCLMVWWWLHMKGWLLANVSNKETVGGICSNLAYFVLIWNISNISFQKRILNFNFFFSSKFKFDRVHGKMLNDTHLKVIYINYIRARKFEIEVIPPSIFVIKTPHYDSVLCSQSSDH